MGTISVRLSNDLLARLDDAAKARRISRSRLVRESLEKTFHDRTSPGTVSCFDLARDLAGTVKRLPCDLADNPKYMAGFGQR